MKKALCAALACIFIAALALVSVAAKQTNVEATALRFEKAPQIDGEISEAEWGEPTFSVYAKDAATKESADRGVNAYNTYLGAVGGAIPANVRSDMSCHVWLRWDGAGFYVAVKVYDPNGHYATRSGENIWNGDCLQFRVDPQGPDSKQKATEPTFDWRTTSWDYVSGTSEEYGFGLDSKYVWNNTDKLVNTAFALVGTTEPRSALNWDYSYESSLPGSLLGVSTAKIEGKSACETSYEVCMPWRAIGGRLFGNGWTPDEGACLGMTLVVMDSAGDGADAYLTWGCGICGGQGQEARATCGGTNAVTLSPVTYAAPEQNGAESSDGKPQTTSPAESGASTEAQTDRKTADNEKTDPDSKMKAARPAEGDHYYSVVPMFILIVGGFVLLTLFAGATAAIITVIVVRKKKKNRQRFYDSQFR